MTARHTGLLAAALALGLGLSTALADDPPATAEVGKQAPDFTLTDLDGKAHTLSAYAGKIVVLEWFNPDCPFVKKHHEANKTMAKLYEKYKDQIVWIAINSGFPGKQGTGADRNKKAVEDYGIKYPICLDEDGKVGRTYEAKTTPHMYVIDKSGVVAYAGAIDNKKKVKQLGDTNYVEQAVDALIAGKAVPTGTSKPYGCSVKYGPQN